MALARTSLPSTAQPDAPVRLCYRLRMAGRGHPTRLYASRGPSDRPLSDGELKRVLPRLHALDVVIARELRSGAVFGQLSDAQVARVLPLLAQRPTRLGDAADLETLEMEDEPLRPRVTLSVADNGRLHLTLFLAPVRGSDDKRIAITDGRLLAGSQAYFIHERSAHPIESSAPWELAAWAAQPTRDLTGRLGPKERDQLVTQLTRAGVPASDLEVLAVRRGPPDRFLARLALDESNDESKEVSIALTLTAEYRGERVEVAGDNPASAYVMITGDATSLIERDLAAEDMARRFVRSCRFRYDRQSGVYRAKGEAALSALDPAAKVFPPDWIVERNNAPTFVRDLEIRTQVTLLEDRGLLDLDIGIGAVTYLDDDERPETGGDAASDEATAQALIEMRELLAWLQSGKRYLLLADGTYVAPSPRFRQGLRVLDDLGAENMRATVSPLCIGLLRLLGDSDAVRAADDATRAWIAEISGTSEPAHLEPPRQLVNVLRDYQLRGLDWLGMLHRHRLTGILADDMGLGKTVQTLALLQRIREIHGPKPSLVVAPTSVVTVWRDESARFTPDLRVGLLHGSPKARDAVDIEAYDLLVTSYGVLRRDADRLAKVSFRYVILDESQAAKNAATQNARAVRRLTSERRLALSGTPIENRPEELWATFDFLAPGFLGNLRQFRKRYARPIAHGDEDALALLRARVQPLVLRRLKVEVAKELPPKIESIVRCEMDRAQRALYDHIAGRLRDQVVHKIEKVGIERVHLDILAALTRLRQICCDPGLLSDQISHRSDLFPPQQTKTPPSAKLALFEELMREALASERRVVVFSQFVQMQKRLIKTIKSLGVDPLWLHGGTRNRDKVVNAFQTPSGPPVIVVSLRAGGTGLTLTRADTVMHYDPWWNPAVERQATDRTHRLGQSQRVTVYKLICANTIEEKVLALAARKDKLANALIASEGGAGSKQITTDDVLALLT